MREQNIQIVLVISFIVSVFAGSTSAFASEPVAFNHKCGHGKAGVYEYTWCIDHVAGSKNPDVLYSYHGLRGNAETWFNDPHGKAISSAISDRTDVPTIISISFGDSWLITDLEGPDDHESLQEVIVHSIMPRLEKRAGFKNGRRLIFGISMGGFNAAQLALKEGHLFSDVVLVCPIVQTVGPFSTASEVNDAIKRQGPDVDPNNYRGALSWMKGTFPDEESWERHNLLSLVKNLNHDSTPIYLTTGRQDEYGFFEGASEFASVAQTQGAPIEWHPMDGHHCVYDAPSIAEHLYGK